MQHETLRVHREYLRLHVQMCRLLWRVYGADGRFDWYELLKGVLIRVLTQLDAQAL